MNPEIYILHATGASTAEFYRIPLPELAHNYFLRQFQENARERLLKILSETIISNLCLGIETIEFLFDLTLELAVDLDLSICLDTGHVLDGFSEPIAKFDALEQCLPNLGEVHLYDAYCQGPGCSIEYGKDYQALGHGDLDERFLNRLELSGFNDPVVLEVELKKALDSLDFIRSIRPGLPTS